MRPDAPLEPTPVESIIRRGLRLRRRRRAARLGPVLATALVVVALVLGSGGGRGQVATVVPTTTPTVATSVPGTVPAPLPGPGGAPGPGPGQPEPATTTPTAPPDVHDAATATGARRAPLLVFARMLPNGNSQILALDAGATEPRVLVDASPTINSGSPALSPDASTIAYSSTRSSPFGGVKSVFDIWLMDVHGGNQRRLTTANPLTQNSFSGYGNEFPTWSPDGRRLAYVAADGRGVGHVWTMDADGSHQAELVGSVPSAFAPSWSPDGRRIAFYTYAYGPVQLWLADASTGAASRVDLPLLQTDRPTWTADGAALLLQEGDPAHTTTVLYDVADATVSALDLPPYVASPVPCGPDQLAFKVAPAARASDGDRIGLIGVDGTDETTVVTTPAGSDDTNLSCGP